MPKIGDFSKIGNPTTQITPGPVALRPRLLAEYAFFSDADCNVSLARALRLDHISEP
jgi:hypothetical protein